MADDQGRRIFAENDFLFEGAQPDWETFNRPLPENYGELAGPEEYFDEAQEDKEDDILLL